MRAQVKIICFVVFFGLFFSSFAHAKVSKAFKEAFEARFVPAVHHEGLDTAAESPEKGKIKTFVVVQKDAVIPAERAVYFITPGEYDYRSAIVDGERVKTRHGQPFVYLPKGTIMALAGVDYVGRTVYLRLLSWDKIPSLRKPDLKPTRVTVMLGFKFGAEAFDSGDVSGVFSVVEEWVKPFGTFEEALAYLHPDANTTKTP